MRRLAVFILGIVVMPVFLISIATAVGEKPGSGAAAGAKPAQQAHPTALKPQALSTQAGQPPSKPVGEKASGLPVQAGVKPTPAGLSAQQKASLQAKTKQRTAQQQANVDKMLSDLQSIKSGSQVTQQQKQQLANDLMTMVEGSTKPSQESVNKLASDLSQATSDGNISRGEQAKLMNDIEAVLNSANIPASEVEAAINDAQQILVASGVTKEEAQMVANDLKAIGAEVQKNAQSAQQKMSGAAASAPARAAPASPPARRRPPGAR